MKNAFLFTFIGFVACTAAISAYAQNTNDLLPNDNVFDTLSVDLKVNGSDGPVNVASGSRITISWESDNAKRCRGNWSKKDLPLNGKISGKLSRSLTTSVTVRMACIDADGNREDDSVVLKITNPVTPPPPPPADQPIIISSCGEITKSGKYVLNNNITNPKNLTEEGGVLCLNIHDVSHVSIDCKGYSISTTVAVRIKNVEDFSLNFCVLKSERRQGDSTRLEIVDSKNGNIIGNDVTGVFLVFKSSGLKLFRNAVKGIYTQGYGTGNIIKDNTFSGGNPSVLLSYGIDNVVTNNKINGESSGIFSKPDGADDAVILQDESNILLQDNTIENSWDCGIETLGLIENAKIVGNTIKNSGLCGIGGWYWSSWVNNTVSQNVVDGASQMFYFTRGLGLRPAGFDDQKTRPTDNKVYFKGNTFDGNTFVNHRVVPFQSILSSSYINILDNIAPVFVGRSVPGEREITSNDFVLENNKFSNNDFNVTARAPFFRPPNMIIDGGGNKCGELIGLDGLPLSNYPLACGRGN